MHLLSRVRSIRWLLQSLNLVTVIAISATDSIAQSPSSTEYKIVVQRRSNMETTPCKGAFITILRQRTAQSKRSGCEHVPLVIRPEQQRTLPMSVCKRGQWIVIVPPVPVPSEKKTSYMFLDGKTPIDRPIESTATVACRAQEASKVLRIIDAYEPAFIHTVYVCDHDEFGFTGEDGICTILVANGVKEFQVSIESPELPQKIIPIKKGTGQVGEEIRVLYEMREESLPSK